MEHLYQNCFPWTTRMKTWVSYAMNYMQTIAIVSLATHVCRCDEYLGVDSHGATSSFHGVLDFPRSFWHEHGRRSVKKLTVRTMHRVRSTTPEGCASLRSWILHEQYKRFTAKRFPLKAAPHCVVAYCMPSAQTHRASRPHYASGSPVLTKRMCSSLQRKILIKLWMNISPPLGVQKYRWVRSFGFQYGLPFPHFQHPAWKCVPRTRQLIWKLNSSRHRAKNYE